MSRVNQFITETIIRTIKKPAWYAVHSLTGIRMQMATRYIDCSMFNASFRVPLDKLRTFLPSPKLVPIECYPGVAEILIHASEFRHVDILSPYNEVAIAIPVSYQTGSKTKISSGFWYLHLPVSTEDARWPGVENYGFPKFVAGIEFSYSSDTLICNLMDKGNKILTLKVKALNTLFQEWESDNITLKDGRMLHSTFSAKGQRGTDETPGGASIIFGVHPIAEELQSILMEFTSFRHSYIPEAEAILSVGREINEM